MTTKYNTDFIDIYITKEILNDLDSNASYYITTIPADAVVEIKFVREIPNLTPLSSL